MERRERMRRGPALLRMIEARLDLTDEQKEKISDLWREFRKEQREAFRKAARRGRDQAEKIRKVREDLLEAAKAGKEGLVERLRRELDELTGVAQQRRIRARFFDKVEKLLTPEQKREFRRFRALYELGLPIHLLASPKRLREALKDLNLTEEQRTDIEALFDRYRRDLESVEGKNLEARRRLAERLVVEIVEVLKPSQKVLLVESVRKAMRKRMMRHAPARPREGAPRR